MNLSERKSLIFNRLIYILAFAAAPISLPGVFAQGKFGGKPVPEFSASAETRQVAVGERFEVVFTLKNGESKRFTPPDFRGFKIIGGPISQFSQTIVNGNFTSSVGWSYILEGTQPGNFTIGPAQAIVYGKTYESGPIAMEVVPSASGNLRSPKPSNLPQNFQDENLFVLAETSAEEVYAGQQLVVNFVVYTRVNIEGIDILEEPKFEGFYAKELFRFDNKGRRVKIKGKEFSARILKSYAIFPQKSGSLDIEPMRFQFGVAIPGAANDPVSRFFGQNLKPVATGSEAKTIRVKPLPEPAPESFSGGVGHYVLSAEIDRKELSTDDALTLRLTVRGNGDGKRFLPPKMDLPVEFEVYEPKTIEQNDYENGQELLHQQTFEFAILPRQAGQFDLRPEVSVFDPDSGRYVVKKTPNGLKINVLQGKNNNRAALQNRDSEQKLSPIRTSADWKKRGSLFAFSPIFWLLVLLPVLTLGFLFFREKQRERRLEALKTNPVLQSKIKADAALERFAAARKLMENGDARGFFDELSRSMQGFLTAKFDLPTPFPGNSKLRELLLEKGVPTAETEGLLEIFQACELAVFAGQADLSKAGEMLRKAESLFDFRVSGLSP